MNYGSVNQYVFIIISFALIMPFGNTNFAKPYIHILQLESYKVDHYKKWVAGNKKYLIKQLIALIPLLAYGTIGLFVPDGINNSFATFLMMAGSMFYYAVSGLYYSIINSKKFKKELVITERVKRLIGRIRAISAVIWGLLSGLAFLAAMNSNILVFYLLVMLPTLAMPQLVAFAAKSMEKTEEDIKQKYYDEAKNKLEDMEDLVKIGITGSYGKTSTKFILATILSQKFNTLATPYSYNTPMGVVRVVREQLDESYEVFVAEMGAKQIGDIKELCDLVEPQYGLLSAIGPQHLETFGTLENIIKTKYELIEELPEDGVGFFPIDNEICRMLYDKTSKKKIAYSLDGQEGYETPLRIKDYCMKTTGSSFTLTDGKDEIFCQTILLGKHNIENILGCATVAYEMGLTLNEIERGIWKVQTIEHRLQIMPTNNGVTVIDDAFNSNPAGTRAAIDVLSNFEGRKIVVTPGMVELGDQEYEENKKFGCYMADKINFAILVGPKHSAPIREGLIQNGFDSKNIITVKSLDDATSELSKITRRNDIVLFENDLPDNYDE